MSYTFKTIPEARFFVDVILFMQSENCPNPATVSEVATPDYTLLRYLGVVGRLTSMKIDYCNVCS